MPYTGGQKNAQRDLDFAEIFQNSDKVNRITQILKEIEHFSAKRLMIGSADRITQFIRGELYVVIDFILCAIKPPEPEELKVCIEILEAFINLSVIYLTSLPIYMKDVFLILKSILKEKI